VVGRRVQAQHRRPGDLAEVEQRPLLVAGQGQEGIVDALGLQVAGHEGEDLTQALGQIVLR
jgi:hypothetical protein